MADKAIDVMYNLINKERADRTYLLHVSDATKSLPPTLQMGYLEKDYRTKCHTKNYEPEYTWWGGASLTNPGLKAPCFPTLEN